MEVRDLTGIILAGGKSRRMGTNKAFLPIGEERLIDRTIRTFKDIFSDVIVVTNTPLDYLEQDCTIATDIIKSKGALGGIYTGLFYASCEHAFISACDMPLLNKKFIEYMIERCNNDHDIVVPELPEGFQPLHAIYSRRCLPAIKRMIGQDKLKITGFYKGLKTVAIPENVITQFDPEGKMFLNVNTQEEFREILLIC